MIGRVIMTCVEIQSRFREAEIATVIVVETVLVVMRLARKIETTRKTEVGDFNSICWIFRDPRSVW